VRIRVKVFNATFNNISVISWQSALLVEETRVTGENHQPVASHLNLFYEIVTKIVNDNLIFGKLL
jgi:hypothetical protein